MINKKGISPLIVTVLLIGFTIVLAALVIRWGSELFSSQIKTQTCDNEATISCTSNVDVKITNAIYDEDVVVAPNPVPVNTKNLHLALVSNGKQKVDNFIVRVHKNNGEVVAINNIGGPLDQFATANIDTDVTGVTAVLLSNCPGNVNCRISVIPVISHTTSKGDTCVVTCGQSEQNRNLDSIY